MAEYHDSQVRALAELMRGRRALALTGAGMSTGSGLPDYRGVGSTEVTPVTMDMFTADPVWYRWFWYRTETTWKSLLGLEPNEAHQALARMERAGALRGVVTQNIDGLDRRAGTTRVWELHGSYHQCSCLECGRRYARTEVSTWLTRDNPGLVHDTDPARIAIIAEADRAAAEACYFRGPACPACSGLIRPGIVMFGDVSPEGVIDQAISAARMSDVLLIAGTSLTVNTPQIIVREAMMRGASIAVVNAGPCAADEIADMKIEASVLDVLPALADLLA